ncbi:Lactose regulatory protein LAC9 [Teratosphaeria destructans]|uniref:Lactose regulatory protein LAC9 n=1 Tax=Teratosphaeria destructans TaxID=418781 RepID=A0A9W7W439_9PEZI|nr:Lactose regulatory protein LAC9 [Teratosphaeria destructans]
MDKQLPLSEPAAATNFSELGLSESACNECKRRKGRCDRQLPECGPCHRNKRHCLYEKHSKTPLTRKHLTSVEERLRQAELRARQFEKRAQAAEARLHQAVDSVPKLERQKYTAGTIQSPGPPACSSQHRPRSDHASTGGDAKQRPNHFTITPPANDPAGPRTFPTDSVSPGWQQAHTQAGPHGPEIEPFGTSLFVDTSNDVALRTPEMEVPPPEADDFSWDEQSPVESFKGRHSSSPAELHDGNDDDEGVADGMALLSMEDKGTGYLGISSGTAMLKMLLPESERRRTSRRSTSDRLRPVATLTTSADEGSYGWVPTPVFVERRIHEIDLDAAITAYFSLFHVSYPLVHEPSFRAQYSQVVPRPAGKNWNALAYMIGAMGIFTTAQNRSSRDLDLFEAAKANMSIDSLETGNLTLVQVLMLMANYIQKRGKPNSGYNYLGLALHMAMGLGLHKEFHNWRVSPLAMEIRRRVWWVLTCFYVGAVITFGRPLSWPSHGVEAMIPLNCEDRDLTHLSTTLPPAKPGLTTYSAISAQARFHLATMDIYGRVISVNFPTAAELIRLDDERIEAWRSSWQDPHRDIPPRYLLSQRVLGWRCSNFRIIMYRPFVIRHVLSMRTKVAPSPLDPATQNAIDRCLHESKASISSIHAYWAAGGRSSMASWYSLYFLFQASLIPCICLRNDPTSPHAVDWVAQVEMVLNVFDAIYSINQSSREYRQVVLRLCGDFLPTTTDSGTHHEALSTQPIEESPQTQLSGMYPMMWPSANSADAEVMMPDSSWTTFLNEMQPVSFMSPDEPPMDASWSTGLPGGFPHHQHHDTG